MSNVIVTPVVTPSIRTTQKGFTMKVSTLSLAVLTVFGLASVAQAQVKSDIVGQTNIVNVGETTAGVPAISHIGAHDGAFISFAALQGYAGSNPILPNNWNWTSIDPNQANPPVPSDYDGIGYFDFVQVANEAVYFGEWSGEKDDSTKDKSTHTVYYAGEAGDVVNTLPTQTATYTVVGVNNVDGNTGNFLNGTLTASFGGENVLAGYLSNSSSSLTLNIDADINSSDASFEGFALANGIDGTLGTTRGHFFGTGASALAGLATFDDSSLNTAFGGSKD